jgi:DNA-binding GntR family transcriptional regulator
MIALPVVYVNFAMSPLYQEVYEKLAERINGGIYRRGTTLPTEAKLRKEFGVSTITVRRALHELVLDGLVDSRQGIGNFVRERPRDGVIIELSNFTSSVASGRLRIVRTLLTDELIPASAAVAKKLKVQPGSMLRHLVRLDSEGSAPLSVDEVLMPPAFAGTMDESTAASPLFAHLWQIMTHRILVRTHYDITVNIPTMEEQKQLQIDSTVPVLVTSETVMDSTGKAVMYVVTRYRGDRCRLSGTVLLAQRKTKQGIVGE